MQAGVRLDAGVVWKLWARLSNRDGRRVAMEGKEHSAFWLLQFLKALKDMKATVNVVVYCSVVYYSLSIIPFVLTHLVHF